MSQRLTHLPALIGMVVLAGFVAAAAGALAGSDSTIQLIAMDADPTGNGATTLGHLDPCVRTEPGSDVAVDLIVDAVPGDRPVVGFQVDVDYDPSLLEVIAIDNSYLLGAVGNFELFDALSDTLPDSDGDLLLVVADLASNSTPGANMETGAGVLSRVTLRAKAAGVSAIAPGFELPDVYPLLLDDQNTTIEVRTIAGIKIAIGQDCPPNQTEIEPTELPSLSSLEGSPTPTPTARPTPTWSPSPSGALAVLPAAFPATGGAASGDNSNMRWTMAATALAITGAGAWVWRTRRFRS